MRTFLLFLLFVCGLLFSQLSSAQKIYVRAIGVKGQISTLFKGGSTAKGHENEIEAINYSETDSSCGFLNGGTCKTATGPWIFSMPINPSIINFKNYMYNGKLIGVIYINFVSKGEKPFTYYSLYMRDVFVKMISESSGGNAPQFYIELDPSFIKWTYTEQKPDGSAGDQTSFQWDRTKHTP